MRRALFAMAALLVASLTGCQTQLAKAGSFQEIESFALQLDSEFSMFHKDVKDVIFGISDYEWPAVWDVYER